MGLMTRQNYLDSLDDGRKVLVDGKTVGDVRSHPALAPMVETVARIYDLHNDPAHADLMTFERSDGIVGSRFYKAPANREDLALRRQMTTRVLREICPTMDRFGDETVTALFTLVDRQDLLDRFDTRYARNAARWLDLLQRENLFMTSGNTDPKGDRSRQPFEQDDLDLNTRVVEERPDGVVLRGAKFETGAPYAHVAFIKPTVGNWSPQNADFAIACVVRLNAPGVRMICRLPQYHGGAANANRFEYPLTGGFDEVDTLIVFDDVFIPWEDVMFARQPELAALMRGELGRWAAQGYLTRCLAKADLLVGTALLVSEHSGTIKIPPVRSKISQLMMHRQAVEAFLLAAEAACEETPSGLAMPNQSIQNAGRIYCSQTYATMVQLLREIIGGQPVMLPGEAMLNSPETRDDVMKYFAGAGYDAPTRLRAMHLARELTASAYAGRTQSYQLFAETPIFAQENALFATYDREESMALARRMAGIEPAATAAPEAAPRLKVGHG
ncbi:4-hydroxyphenylacetate 3-hydroxylase [Acuticoccus sediminis]|uniref:4-hydroxyphenylacetate 3-hydroxylase n=1 Tax=Acuticoccus sediminis TaxID=2184697 RepID=A0A8B2NWQ4_9HYPH|nr:4-hydroxyphenylacetate 3-hydroxylase N-terminal domain-containing protein [Acuticoccus sediminis]RAI01782.1 4-hydroxyphenylacetate 3-hydroxylase [Acuticoccus sediminis]